MMNRPLRFFSLLGLCSLLFSALPISAAFAAEDRLVFKAPAEIANGKKIVLVAGDEEYRTEESMPMLGKILSQKHGFQCTVLFAFGPDGANYIDANNSSGIRGFDSLQDADAMIIGTRFRKPDSKQAEYITEFLNAGKPVIGIRTSTHAFQGNGTFGSIPYGQFGLKVLGETWVSHHGRHKSQGARGEAVAGQEENPILNGVGDIFCPSDVYGVIHLTDEDQILMRAAVTESLNPASPAIEGPKNDPKQPFAWLHTYDRPNGKGTGTSFCTTGGASVDFVDEDLRRMIVNAAYHLTGLPVPEKADVQFVDPFYPSFYGFIREKDYWKNANLTLDQFDLGSTTTQPDPPGSPEWNHRPRPEVSDPSASFEFRQGERIALMGGSLAERMNLFGYFESILHTRFPEKQLVFRNFGWPADAVDNQQRPDNYTKIDDPLVEFGPELFICFFGYNESFEGASAEQLANFKKQYANWMDQYSKNFSKPGREVRFILISPAAFEQTSNEYLKEAAAGNQNLALYAQAVRELAAERNLHFVDLMQPTQTAFNETGDLQYTINGIHLNEKGDRFVAEQLDDQLFGSTPSIDMESKQFQQLRAAVNDKSWFHLQDYRMLNGWYVYGGRRTWDTETFPKEYQKIRKMVEVRDQYVWDIAAGKEVAKTPDDSKTGEVFIPETMFGTRDEGFRKMREPTTLIYPSPEESIDQMTVPEGFKVELFASEREFPELSNPTQMTFDTKGRLWVSCMTNYPQWLPGAAKPGDKLLIFEDQDNDGKADVCKTFYDDLICPTGFEFHEDGVLVVDEPRILFLQDTDGDDVADKVTHVIDGIATDDTHHAMGAWEWSHGGLLYMLEGVSMSTTIETPWGPFRNKGPSGAYVLDPKSWRFRHFRTPGYGNPWCMVFDRWGMGCIGDGTNAQQHWTSPLSGYPVNSRRTLQPNFNNEGMRPAVGNEFLFSRQFPESVQGQFIYACVINMHGMPRFELGDDPQSAGFTGKRIEDLLSSTDNFFRPVDPQIGPDGALWFGDWCNALIGHMQYSQRDPNRDHQHGRLYRLVYQGKDLIKPELQVDSSIPELLDQLNSYELRTRYRARRELRARDKQEVLKVASAWISNDSTPYELCEVMWLQESFRELDPQLIARIMKSDDFHARSAAVHSVTNEIIRYPGAMDLYRIAIADEHPRVRLEALRGLSFVQTAEALEVALKVLEKPLDYWLEYTLEHTLHALRPQAIEAERAGNFLASSSQQAKDYYRDYVFASGPGGKAVKPLKDAENPELPKNKRNQAIKALAAVKGGNSSQGVVVFERVCSGCHQIKDKGKAFGPKLDGIGARYNRENLIRHILWPNETIAKGFETVQLVTIDGLVVTGFILEETDDHLKLGVATQDGKGKTEVIPKDDIELRKEMKASSMPEGLVKTIAPSEFLDLLEYLQAQTAYQASADGWISTGLADVGELRKHGDLIEISRDAELKLGNNFATNWTKHTHLVLSAADPTTREFAFHSPNKPTKDPAIQIRLTTPVEIGHVTIQNRRNPTFYKRAEGLAIWVSDDGQNWAQVWKAESPAAVYEAEIPEGTQGRFLKVGLDGEGIFHLNQIVVYGKRLDQ